MVGVNIVGKRLILVASRRSRNLIVGSLRKAHVVEP